MIPGRCHRTVPIDYDRVRCWELNMVERVWFKKCCRLATRFEKTASSYLGS